MKKSVLILLITAVSFTCGFAFNAMFVNAPFSAPPLKRVTGIGGIFFKCKEPEKLREWYGTHLGLNVNPYGSVFEWRQGADSTQKGFTQWSPFKETTKYFGPSTKDFMINYRVADLSSLVTELRKEQVKILDTIETFSYGKFVHIMDEEGNKIELWEPYDTEYGKLGSGTTK